MAKSNAVWGIDIGQCALKALRCRPHETDEGRIVVEAIDIIEYPKILSQPEANSEELVRDALDLFLSRNEVKGDRVAISVPGQNGLARFIKLPPVEAKKIPDIVKYEARQQIPFALEDVVWDYQPLAGGSEDDGYALEKEVGLFAMKKDQIARALKPFEEAGIEVDVIQLAPLAIYNFFCFDHLNNLDEAGPFDPENPPPSTLLISLGTDTTDLVITNGFRVWQRNIPIGGNHFTKALTKELKLTFAKAEDLKRNATKSEDPKAIFQAMRPIFSNLVAEIQRSIGFFERNNSHATLGKAIVLGNTTKLPGLPRFLAQNLDQEVEPLGEFTALVGGSVTAGSAFQKNQLAFGVAYGLCVQALDRSQLKTNLLPEEIVTTRIIRSKKPWAVVAAALLLVGMTMNYASHYSMWKSAALGEANPKMAAAIKKSKAWTMTANGFSGENSQLKEKFSSVLQIGANLRSNVDGRLLWLELLRAVDTSLPRDDRPEAERTQTAEDVSLRTELHIESLDCQHFEDVSQWYAGIEQFYSEANEGEPASAGGDEDTSSSGDEDASENEDTSPTEEELESAPPEPEAFDSYANIDEEGEDGASSGPSGPGWVIEMVGYHFHNADISNEGKQFIQNTFIKNLEEGTVTLPDGPGGEPVEVPIADLGIHHPVVMTANPIQTVTALPNSSDPKDAKKLKRGTSRTLARKTSKSKRNASPEIELPETWELRRYEFTIQFCWQPKTRTERLKKEEEPAGDFQETVSVDKTDALAARRDNF